MHRWKDRLERSKPELLLSLGSAFFWGLLAHAYCFFDNNFSHDSLAEMIGSLFSKPHKQLIGRVFVPYYWAVFRGDTTLPWLIGCLALLWIGLSVFVIARIFHVKSRLSVFLISGSLTVNMTIIATAATYLHDLDCYMFALLCSVGAVYLWNRSVPLGLTAGAVLVAVALGIYPVFAFVTVTLVMLVSIFALLDHSDFRHVFTKGLWAIAMLVLAAALYSLATSLILRHNDMELNLMGYTFVGDSGASVSAVLSLFVGTYRSAFEVLKGARSMYSARLVKYITILLVLCAVGIFLYGPVKKKLRGKEAVLYGCLVLLLPFAMNGIYFLCDGHVHDVMVYPMWFFYVIVILLTDWFRQQAEEPIKWASYPKWISALLVAVLLYGNVQFANGVYLKKDMDYDAFLSLMTRVADRMENYEGYIPGETEVVFVGLPKWGGVLLDGAPGMEQYLSFTGLWSADGIFVEEPSRYEAYFHNMMATSLRIADWDTWYRVLDSEETAKMKPYPDKSCVSMQDGTLVVKLSELPG